MAVVPPQHAVEDLEAFLAPRREAGAFRWSLADDWHVTLAFAASAQERCLDDLTARLARAAARRASYDVQVAGGGAFPHPDRARVLYGGIDGSSAALTELDRMATGARAAMTKAGVEVAGQRFRPHLTLARMGRPESALRWVRLLDAYRGPRWPMSELVLVESHLGEGPARRPRYEVLDRFACGRAPSDGA